VTPAPNVLGQNRTKGEARLGFFGSRVPEGSEAFTVYYVPLYLFYQ